MMAERACQGSVLSSWSLKASSSGLSTRHPPVVWSAARDFESTRSPVEIMSGSGRGESSTTVVSLLNSCAYCLSLDDHQCHLSLWRL